MSLGSLPIAKGTGPQQSPNAANYNNFSIYTPKETNVGGGTYGSHLQPLLLMECAGG